MGSELTPSITFSYLLCHLGRCYTLPLLSFVSYGIYIFTFTGISIACNLLFYPFFDLFVIVSVSSVVVIVCCSLYQQMYVFLIYLVHFFADPMPGYVGVPDVLRFVWV